ncbi:MAG: hypothetical protein H5T61_14105 [Thermoflexales bacterium]|nr:hypothetical protein [Thermoflexales bacterium]
MGVKGRVLMIITLTATLASVVFGLLYKTNAHAACGSGPYYVADVTAYAMGNRYSYPGGQQHEIVIGDAAAHYGRYPWGTCIYLPYDAVTIRTYDGELKRVPEMMLTFYQLTPWS